MRQTADDLREALGVIEDKRRWTRGSLWNGSRDYPQFCAMGGIEVGLGMRLPNGHFLACTPDVRDRYRNVGKALAKMIRPDFDPQEYDWEDVIAFFNDDEGTKHSMVVTKFKEAIIAEEAFE